MYDSFNRSIDYLRISVTDRCNLRCVYCMPAGGINLLQHDEILRIEEIVDVVKIAVEMGISKVRITGGEPLVRKGVVSLVEQLASLRGIGDLGLTTNGVLLPVFAACLAKAGLKRINISLDTLNPEKYAGITRGGDIRQVLRGIEAVKAAGMHPVKINCVLQGDQSSKDADDIRTFCNDHGLEARFIRRMSLADGEFSVVEGGSGGDCARCNRLRLTANGKLKPCLFSDLEFDVRRMGARAAILEALRQKPECGTSSHNHLFHNIGG